MIANLVSANGTPSRRAEVRILNFDTSMFRFRDWFEHRLGCGNLGELHKAYPLTATNFPKHVKDARDRCEDGICDVERVLSTFIRDVVEPELGATKAKQQSPSVRVHFKVDDPAMAHFKRLFEHNTVSDFLEKAYFLNKPLGVFHRDGDYGLPADAWNIWVPMTRAFGTNSLWVGSEHKYGRDALPLDLEYGQLAMFRGSTRWHGVVWNTSAPTRVSFDLRVIPVGQTRSI